MKNKTHLSGILIFALFVSHVYAQNDRIPYRNHDLFLSGANVPWVSFARDVGPGFTDLTRFSGFFQDVHNSGGNAMRLWLHTTGVSTPAFDASGVVTGPGNGTIADLKNILDRAEENQIGMILCLWSFDMLRKSIGARFTSRNAKMLTDTTFTLAYIRQALVPMVEALKGHPAIIAWEIFNEPEGMSEELGWDFNEHVPMADIQRFINLCAGAIHRADPQALITNGAWSFISQSDVTLPATSAPLRMGRHERTVAPDKDGLARYRRYLQQYHEVTLEIEDLRAHLQRVLARANFNYYTDARLIAAGGDSLGILDFYTVHYYNWAGTDLSPFHQDYAVWGLDKAVAVTEYAMGNDFGVAGGDKYRVLFERGYAGALAWDWKNGDRQAMRDGMKYLFENHREAVDFDLRPGQITFFRAEPDTIEQGESSVLTWRTSPGSSAFLNGEPVDPSGSMMVSPTSTTTYTLESRGIDTETRSVIVAFLPPGLIKSFSADRTILESGAGDSTVLRWRTTKGSAVTLNGEPVNFSDTLVVRPETTTTYVLQATGVTISRREITIQVLPQEQVNRALHKPVFTSSNETCCGNDNPQFAVDGNYQTRWSSEWNDREWIYVDLEDTLTVNRVVLYWEVAYGKSYDLQIFSDNKWQTIYSTSSGDGGVDDITGLSARTRYVRMLGTERGTQWGYSLWEFEIYGTRSVATAVPEQPQVSVPVSFALHQNHPNPFNPVTTIGYSLPLATQVRLEIFDLTGRRVADLVHARQAAGEHRVTFNAARLSSGVYYYRMQAGDFSAVRRMILIK